MRLDRRLEHVPWLGHVHPAWCWLAGLSLLAVVLLNAWVSDDAYITFRTCHNLVHGHGPVFNVGERVQTFTNPLWMLLFSAAYAFTGESFLTAIALSALLLSLTVALPWRRVLGSGWSRVLLCLLLGTSLSFVEYATSGLENMLNGLLLSAFLAVWWRDDDARRLLLLSLLAGLGCWSRMDTALLYLPCLATACWQRRSWRAVGQVLLGLGPFIAWEAFALVYYGFPFPNTAYAKLNAGIPAAAFLQRGIWYYAHTLHRDPVTLVVIVSGFVAAVLQRKALPVALGMLLYCLYILRIGGDFMGGRFFFLPCMVGALLLARGLVQSHALKALWLAAFLVGAANPGNPWVNGWQPQQPRSEVMYAHDIADERGWYRDMASLAAWNDSMWVFGCERNLDRPGQDTAATTVLLWDYLGYMGYGAGPSVKLYDRYALADPLLARLPMAATDDWRVGHYARVFPLGYRKTLRTGDNHIEDPQLREYCNRLWRVTQGPIWSIQRFSEIYHFNLGKYDRLIDYGYYRAPTQTAISIDELSQPHSRGEPFLAPGQVQLYSQRPLTVHLDGDPAFSGFEISLQSEADYALEFLKGGKAVGELRLQQQWIGGGLAVYRVEVPAEVVASGFDAIRIEGLGGNEHYAIGHLVPTIGYGE